MKAAINPIERAQLRLKLAEQRDQQIAALKTKRRELLELNLEIETLNRRRDELLQAGRCPNCGERSTEGRRIALALKAADGRITEAARMLGMKYQTLAAMIENRYKSLAHLRTEKHSRNGNGKTERPLNL